MTISDRDFALLQEEIKCLRKKLSTLVSTSGGYTDQLTSPGSSIFPNDMLTNCGCGTVITTIPDPDSTCFTQEEDTTTLGDLVTDIKLGGVFKFDAIDGVRYLPPGSDTFENRNTGLMDTSLEHGTVDPWWYRKNSPNEDGVILWRVGLGKVLRSDNAGRTYWQSKAPEAPTGYDISDIKFVQILADPFQQNYFYLLATTSTAPYKTWIFKTVDDGQNWDEFDLTDFNARTQRFPVWMAINGNGGSLIWVTSWHDANALEVLKLNNDTPMTISDGYSLGPATYFEVENKYSFAAVTCALDDTDSAWFYGRMNDPMSNGLTHIIRTDSSGGSWTPTEQSYELDWVGSLQIGLKDDAGSGRNYYAVRNKR